MEERDSCPNWSFFESLILESNSEILSIQSKRNLPLVHIEENSQDTSLLEWFSIFITLSIAAMSQLPEAIIGIAKLIITKGIATAENWLWSDSNFQLMLCPSISNYLPIMLPIHKRSVGNHCSEQIVVLWQESMSAVTWKCDLFRWVVWVPREFMDLRTELQQFVIEPWVDLLRVAYLTALLSDLLQVISFFIWSDLQNIHVSHPLTFRELSQILPMFFKLLNIVVHDVPIWLLSIPRCESDLLLQTGLLPGFFP